MKLTVLAWDIFIHCIQEYHKTDKVTTPIVNPYPNNEILKQLLYKKNWIDTVQWHYEDIIRDKNIQAEKALLIKRKIDASNQERTDMVEFIDTWFLDKYKNIIPQKEAKINTESPAWALDRFSILALKIYHMNEEVNREDASEEHKLKCKEKLKVLLNQKKDLSTAIEELIDDIATGKKYMKVYKQMKMYNDEELNPILRKNK